MLMLSRAPAARVYRSRERKNENLRRSYRSARAAQGVMAKKVQRNGSRQMKCCYRNHSSLNAAFNTPFTALIAACVASAS